MCVGGVNSQTVSIPNDYQVVWSINDVKQVCKSTTGMGLTVVITIHCEIPTSMVPDSDGSRTLKVHASTMTK